MGQTYLSAEIKAPAAIVFAWLVEPEKRKAWSFGLLDCAAVSEGAPRAGAQYHDVYELSGRRYELVTEIVEYAPPERLRLSIVARGAFTTDALYTLGEHRGWTTLELEQTTVYRHWLAKLIGFLITRGVQKKLEKDFEILKATLDVG